MYDTCGRNFFHALNRMGDRGKWHVKPISLIHVKPQRRHLYYTYSSTTTQYSSDAMCDGGRSSHEGGCAPRRAVRGCKWIKYAHWRPIKLYCITLWYSILALYSLFSCLLATHKEDRPQHKCFKKAAVLSLFRFHLCLYLFKWLSLLQFALMHPFPDKSQGHLFSEKSALSLSRFLPMPVFKIMHIF